MRDTIPFTPPPQDYNFQPEGTFPPRLIVAKFRRSQEFYEYAIWLHPDAEGTIIPGELKIEVANNQCQLIDLGQAGEPYLLNNEPFHGTRILQDGDLIHRGWGERMIFVADPAQTRYEYRRDTPWQTPQDYIAKHYKIKVTELMRQMVRFNGEGISLDNGINFVRWDEITQVFIDSWDIPKVNILVIGHSIDSRTGIYSINRSEMKSLLAWLDLASPVDLPFINELRSSKVAKELGAYKRAVHAKILVPAQEKNIEPFLPPKKLFPERNPLKEFLILMLVAYIGLWLLLIYGVADDQTQDYTLVEAILLGTGYTCAVGFILFVLWGIPWAILSTLYSLAKKRLQS